MSVSFIIAPQFSQTLNFDLKEFIPKRTTPISNKGVKNNKIKKFPNKLNINLKPKKNIIKKVKIL